MFTIQLKLFNYEKFEESLKRAIKSCARWWNYDYPKCGPKTQLRCYSIEHCDPEFTEDCPCVCVRI